MQAIRKWRSPEISNADVEHASAGNEKSEVVPIHRRSSSEGNLIPTTDNSDMDEDFSEESSPEVDRIQEMDVLSGNTEPYEPFDASNNGDLLDKESANIEEDISRTSESDSNELGAWGEENDASITDTSILNESFFEELSSNVHALGDEEHSCDTTAVENGFKTENCLFNTDNSIMNNGYYEPNAAEVESCLQTDVINQVLRTTLVRFVNQGDHAVNYSEQTSGLQNVHTNNDNGIVDRGLDFLRRPETISPPYTLTRPVTQSHFSQMQVEIDRLKEENTNLFIENINLKEVQEFMKKELSQYASNQRQLKRELNQKCGHLGAIICDLRRKIKTLKGENLVKDAAIILQRKMEYALKDGQLNGAAVKNVARGNVVGEQRKPVKRLQRSHPQFNHNLSNKVWCSQNQF